MSSLRVFIGSMKIVGSKTAKQNMVFGQIVVFITLLLCFVNVAAARQIFVAASGGRPNGSGTIDDPLDTLDRAVEKGLSGDTVVLRGGIHEAGNIWYTGRGGEPGAFLTIDRYLNERVVITGKRLVIESQYVRIQNIDFQNVLIGVRHQERNGWRYS